jgi:hypothetical protein
MMARREFPAGELHRALHAMSRRQDADAGGGEGAAHRAEAGGDHGAEGQAPRRQGIALEAEDQRRGGSEMIGP